MKNKFNFFKHALLTCLGILIFAAGFNFFINPYAIFDAKSINGVNTSKYGARNHTALSKTYMVIGYKPETIILGTSRFDIGIDPASPAIPIRYRPVFNFGMPGVSVYRQFRSLQHAVSYHKPKLVIFELGFESFLKKTGRGEEYPPTGGNFENRLNVRYDGTENTHMLLKLLKDYASSLVTLTALADSVKTIWAGEKVYLNSNGLSNGYLRFGAEVANKGHFSVFRDVLQHQMSGYNPGNMELNESSAFKAIADVIKLCGQKNIELKFIIPPYHASQMELWRRLGLWDKFEEFKRMVANTINRYRKKDHITIELYDFAFHNELTVEDIPPYGDKKPMKWFWEPIHFKKGFGDVILQTLFNNSDNTSILSIGEKITPTNIEHHIVNARRAREIYSNTRRYVQQTTLIYSVVH